MPSLTDVTATGGAATPTATSTPTAPRTILVAVCS
jgi:hypothetical protein